MNPYEEIQKLAAELRELKIILNEKAKAEPEKWKDYVPFHKLKKMMDWSSQTGHRYLHGTHPNPKYRLLSPKKKKKVMGTWWIHKSEINRLFGEG
ncbi:MAG: hypothetical protein AAFU64_08915, partial [Bacteroidota bacterium]